MLFHNIRMTRCGGVGGSSVDKGRLSPAGIKQYVRLAYYVLTPALLPARNTESYKSLW